MKIKKIVLQNVRSHVNTEVVFNEGVNVITGRTGSGKSSLLMALEYALFGSEANIRNNALLRRGAKKGFVVVVFEINGSEYEVKRGWIKVKNKVGVDNSSLIIKKDGVTIPIIARVKDFDEKIKEILNYPKNVNGSQVFRFTSYTRQDEIRKIIELSGEERQEWIDKLLGLDKYKLAWENLKTVIDHFKSAVDRLSGEISNETFLKERVNDLKKRVEESEKTVLNKREKLNESREKLLTLNKELIELKKLREEQEKLRVELSKKLGVADRLREEINKVENALNKFKVSEKDLPISEVENFESLKEELKIRERELAEKQGLINHLKQLLNNKVSLLKEKEELLKNADLTSVISDPSISLAKVDQLIILKEEDLRRLEEELKSLNQLRGVCPMCKQELSQEHLKSLKNKLLKEKTCIENDLTRLKNNKTELISLREEFEKKKKLLEVKQEVETLRDEIKKLKNELNSNNNAVNELEKVVTNLKEKVDHLSIIVEFVKKREELTSLKTLQQENERTVSKLKKRLNDSIFKKYEELSKKVNVLEGSIKILNEELNVLLKKLYEERSELNKVEEELKNVSVKKELLKKRSNDLELLTRLREDLRSIRESLRSSFLEDFRDEFQRVFEEIRGEESEYVVHIKDDYEPIAFSSTGEEVPINFLSGGERTSVALAYRLALSFLTSKITGVSRSEVLIFDEPTVGFDDEDVKKLPELLSRVDLPQVIIVTHERVLESMADHNFVVEKVNGVSQIRVI